MITSQIMIYLPFAICTIFIGYLGDNMALSCYGVCVSLINVFFNSFFYGFQEVLGSYSARGFGSKNFKMMRKALYQVFIYKFLI